MDTNQTPRNESERKSYTTPELVEYGHLADLTQANNDDPVDPFFGTTPTTL